MMPGDNEEYAESKFNAGMAQMMRIHNLQQLINQCNLNPFELDFDPRIRNYQVKFNTLNSLLMEAHSKLTSKERDDIEKMRDRLSRFMKGHPVVSIRTRINREGIKKIDYKLWDVTETFITEYEAAVKDLLEKHGINSPKKSEGGLF